MIAMGYADRTLLEAARLGYIGAAKWALDHGANVDVQDDRFYDYYTPLHWAAHRCDTELCRLLLQHKANVNHQDGSHLNTPLHCAAKHGRKNADICRMLIEHGADLSLKNDKRETPRRYEVVHDILTEQHQQAALNPEEIETAYANRVAKRRDCGEQSR